MIHTVDIAAELWVYDHSAIECILLTDIVYSIHNETLTTGVFSNYEPEDGWTDNPLEIGAKGSEKFTVGLTACLVQVHVCRMCI